ncbi:lysosomal alpha-mannosidase-like isoform X2 [Dreissena polymorpha]|uniref:lysosomal alpha-mannosidase-like isoform X2 n=1 Tax=Dreissena polymorpha TaxID=45954 RepID=UPI00226483C9|nr:lysosomal alpha-mannosidase-like isoform X2 [Dreissena polymorpha]
MILFHGFVFFLSLIGCHAIPVERNAECGYGSCNPVKDDMINVHLVPHTHDDVGWLKTVDQYYYGARNIIQNAGVQYVLDSVIQELAGDPSKRFIYVEIAFFARWWREQDESMQTLVKGLVNNGQLEFILGGWCMNDEASTHYNAIIDQHSLGFEFLRQNFGECGRPRIGWQIDPFGHSREQASLFAQFGFDGLYFGRLDYQDKDTRLNQTTMEMIWHGSPDNLGSKADLFTGVLPNLYQPPDGFCFDIFCDDEPIRDDPRLHDYNVDEKVYDFLSAVQDQAKHYKTNHIIMTMGSDFQYQNAHHWYKNMDKLIKYTNMMQTTNNMKVNVLYSTPSCYTYQLNRADKTWPTKKDDFFPYAHRDHSFWSGYFSSRAALKGYERETNTFLQACKQLDALAMLTDMHNNTLNIQVLREAMGVVQHHDGVSGTEKQEVAYDYAMRLANGRTACQKVMNDAFAKLIQKGSEGFMGVAFCDLLNISACEVTQNNKQFVMVVYNPVGHTVSRWLRLPVIGEAYTVMGPDNSPVQTQIVPVTKRTMQIPERNGAIATNELVFKVSIPALGFSTYFIKMSNSKPTKEMQQSRMEKIQGKDFIMKNEHMALTLDGNTGKWKSLKDLHSGIEINVTNDMAVYYGMPGNCSRGDFQPSGAYIFRPNGTAPSGPSSAMLIKGPLVTEVHTSFSSWATLVTRMYTGEPYTEVEWTVGPIPIDDNLGKEVVVRFMTDLKTNSMFYTDANGREIITRKRDYRETWTFNQTEPVAGNYAPVNSRIYIKDDNKGLQFTVLNDRSQGGSSIQDGEVELMVHRRTLYDDCLGVGEPMNETGSDHNGLIIRGKMFVHSGTTDTAAQFHRDFALRQYMAPLPMFAVTDMKYSDYSTYFRTMWSGLKQELPPNVHLLTLEQFGGPPIGPVDTQTYLIRLEHFYEKGEDAELSQPVSVNIQDLFVPFSIVGAEELTLGANLALSDLNRLQWQAKDQYVRDKEDKIYKVEKRVPLSSALDPVMLNPMEIRTLQVTLRGGFPQRKENKFDVFS